MKYILCYPDIQNKILTNIKLSDIRIESVWICCGRYKYQTCLIFFTTVADPLLPLPTNLMHPEASADPNLHNPMLSEASCDS